MRTSMVLCVLSVPLIASALYAENIPLFGLLERSFTHEGEYDNPYTGLAAAEATLTGPGGDEHHIPLFWDGGETWKLRFSPDAAGDWQWSIESSDPGLDGRSGRFTVTPSENRGGLQPMEGRPRHFQRRDGTPFWWMGDTAWALFTNNADEQHDRHAIEHYLDTRAEQGFNVLHAMLISEAGWGNQGGDAFDDLAAQRINPEYWQEVDERLAEANRRGFTVGLALAWGEKAGNPNHWWDFPSQEARLRYARYIAARYGAADTYFIVSGEWNLPEEKSERAEEVFTEIGRELDAADPHGRMIAIHPGGNQSVAQFAGESWMSFGDYQQVYRDLHERALEARAAGPGKPIVNAEYAYYLRDNNGDGVVDKQNSHTLAAIRHATWDIAMAGVYFTTGFGTTYFGGYRDPGPFDPDAAKNDGWEEDVQHVATLFRGLDWWTLEPADHRVTTDAKRTDDIPGGKHHVAPPETAWWALADPGRQYVLYVRGHAGEYRIDLTADTTADTDAKTYNLRQFNPREGTYQDLPPHKEEGPLSYTPPNEKDWVLIATAPGADL